MALSEKFLEVKNLVEIAENGQEALNALYNFKDKNDSAPILKKIDEVIKSLTQIIESIQTETNAFLQRINSSKEKFQEDIREFYNSPDVAHFYGTSVLKIIEGYQAAGSKDTVELNNFVNNFLATISTEATSQAIEENFDQIKSRVGEEAINLLTYGIARQSNAFVRSPKAISNVKETGELIVNDLSDGVKRNVLEVLRNPAKYKQSVDYNGKEIDIQTIYQSIKENVEVSFSQNGPEYELGYTWGRLLYDKDSGYKGTDYFKKKKDKKGNREWKEGKEEELKQINEEIKDGILKILNQNGAEEVLTKMIQTDPMIFVVKSAGTKIIGVLGEILAALAIHQMVGAEPAEAWEWVANVKNKGKELSVDLILHEGGIDGGIQVKGTSKSIEDQLKIGFGKGGFLDTYQQNGDLLSPNIFHKLGFDETISYLQQQNSNITLEHIQEPLESHAFNIPYANNGPGAVRRVSEDFIHENDPKAQSHFRSFIGIYHKMADIANKIYLFFDVFMPDFLYMTKGADAENLLATLAVKAEENKKINTKGNIVYIIGTEAYFADDMIQSFITDLEELKELYKQDQLLSQQMHFTLATEFAKKNKGDVYMKDIVDYLNNSGKINLGSYRSLLTSSWSPRI